MCPTFKNTNSTPKDINIYQETPSGSNQKLGVFSVPDLEDTGTQLEIRLDIDLQYRLTVTIGEIGGKALNSSTFEIPNHFSEVHRVVENIAFKLFLKRFFLFKP